LSSQSVNSKLVKVFPGLREASMYLPLLINGGLPAGLEAYCPTVTVPSPSPAVAESGPSMAVAEPPGVLEVSDALLTNGTAGKVNDTEVSLVASTDRDSSRVSAPELISALRPSSGMANE
jgi:hypothetical protein